MLKSFVDAPGGFKEEMKEINYSIGFEYWYAKQFALRAGYFNESDTKGARKYATFGAGLSCGAGIIKWGDRVEPVAVSDKSIPEFEGTVFDLMKDSFTHYGVDASHLLTKGKG